MRMCNCVYLQSLHLQSSRQQQPQAAAMLPAKPGNTVLLKQDVSTSTAS